MGVEQLYNSVHRKFNQLEIRCGRENQHPERLGPRLSSPGERKRNAVMAIRVEVNMLQFCSVSNSLSHTTLSIKWEVYFSKRSVFARPYCVIMILYAYACVCIFGHGYTTYINLVPDASFHTTCVIWVRVNNPWSGQRQKEYGTWEASERKFRKIPSKKEEKGTDQRQRTEKRKERIKEKLQHAGWKEEKREKTRTDQQRRTKKNNKKTPKRL